VERLKARLASQNEHKLAELRSALPGWELELLGAEEFPPEEGETYYENAREKARFGREVGPADAWALGEDSGIEVERLGGAPGLKSARWAGGADEPRGEEGFGFDPVFIPDGEERTVAELGNAWKAENSHRARAARALS